jgi:hypothetical protein
MVREVTAVGSRADFLEKSSNAIFDRDSLSFRLVGHQDAMPKDGCSQGANVVMTDMGLSIDQRSSFGTQHEHLRAS